MPNWWNHRHRHSGNRLTGKCKRDGKSRGRRFVFEALEARETPTIIVTIGSNLTVNLTNDLSISDISGTHEYIRIAQNTQTNQIILEDSAGSAQMMFSAAGISNVVVNISGANPNVAGMGATVDLSASVSNAGFGDLVLPVLINGGVDNDTIIGTSASSAIVTIHGGSGDDSISGGGSRESVLGGAGKDFIDGNEGEDSIFGEDDDDSLSGGLGFGFDLIDGGIGNDEIVWDAAHGNDTMTGGGGNDTFIAQGSLFQDTFKLKSSSSTQMLLDVSTVTLGINALQLNSFETIHLNGHSNYDEFYLGDLTGTATTSIVFDGGANHNYLFGPDVSRQYSITGMGTGTVSGAGNVQFLDIYNVKAGLADDKISFASGGFSLYVDGGAGNDTLIGGSFGDYLVGGDGNDSIEGGAWGDRLEGQAGDDTLLGREGDDSTFGGDDQDLLIGYIFEGNDTVAGGNGLDQIIFNGSSGFDDIVVGLHNSTTLVSSVPNGMFSSSNDVELIEINAFEGDDILRSNSLTGSSVSKVTFNGGAGSDWLFGPLTGTTFQIKNINEIKVLGPGNYSANATENLLGSAGNDLITVDLNARLDGAIDAYLGNDTLIGGSLNDQMIGNFGDDLFIDRGGNDTLSGNDDSDTIYAADGNDTFIGGNGLDYLVMNVAKNLSATSTQLNDGVSTDQYAELEVLGVTGNATANRIHVAQFTGAAVINGGDGDDSIFGAIGGDFIDAGAGHDLVYGQQGDNDIVGGDGNDTVVTLDQNDVVMAGSGDDRIYANGGDDYLNGEDGNDAIDAGAGADTLIGGINQDTLIGGTGTDTLDGDDGNDVLDGGADDDQISGGLADDTVIAGAGNDMVFLYEGNDTADLGAGNDYAEGGDGADRITSGIGNDTVLGQAGSDTIDGGDGADLLSGGDQDDFLLGAIGNDTIDGGLGTDLAGGGPGINTITNVP